MSRALRAAAAALAVLSSAGPARADAGASSGADSTTTQHRGAHPTEGAVKDPRAERGRGDGIYGRFAGDVLLAVGAGLEVDFDAGAARPTAWLVSRVYDSAGLYAVYRQGTGGGDPLARALGFGATLEPLFLLRWSADREWGLNYADLVLDSLSLSAGLVLAEPAGGNFADLAGADLGLGLGLPLLGRAGGPWLRARAVLETGRPELAGLLFAQLEWQWFFAAGLLE